MAAPIGEVLMELARTKSTDFNNESSCTKINVAAHRGNVRLAMSTKYVAGLSLDAVRNPLMIVFLIRCVKRLSATGGDTSPTYGP